MSRRVLIIDDERLARVRIRRFLEQEFPELVIAEAADGFDAIERIPPFVPDILFLDIEMPELTGFDVLHHMEKRPFHIIFQTAFDEFAVRAFEENACDYLLKPFSDERLCKSVERALVRAPTAAALDGLDAHLVCVQRFLDRIVVSVGPQRSKLIDQHDVLCFLSESHTTRVVLERTDYAYDYSLTFLEQRLDPRYFLRVHRNAIVHLKAVTGFGQTAGPSLTLKNGLVVKVARDRKQKVWEVLEKGGWS